MKQIAKTFLLLVFFMGFFLSEAQSQRKVAFETTHLKGQVKKAYPFKNLKCRHREEPAIDRQTVPGPDRRSCGRDIEAAFGGSPDSR